MLKIVFVFLLLMPFKAFAQEIDIIDYVVDHNPKIRALRDSQGMNIKLEGKASAFAGTLGDTTDKGAVGITLTVPLIDTREKKERLKEIVSSEESLRQQAAQVLLSLRESQAEIRELFDTLKVKYAHLEWMRKRVQAGVDYQKEYHKEYEAYMSLHKAQEQAKARVSSHMAALFALVDRSARAELKARLEMRE